MSEKDQSNKETSDDKPSNDIKDMSNNQLDSSESRQPTIISSLCMSCHKQGITKLLLIEIPFFKNIIVMSFECEQCGFKNNDVQMASELQEKAIKFTLKVLNSEDLNRMVVINAQSKLLIPEIDFEIPKMKKALVTTVQGLFEIFIRDLEQHLDNKETNEENKKIEDFIAKLKEYEEGKPESFPYQIILTDYTGNSYISKISSISHDESLQVEHFYRSKQQLIDIGYLSEEMNKDPSSSIELPKPGKSVMKMTDIEARELIKKMQGPSKKKSDDDTQTSKTIQEQAEVQEVFEIPVDCYVCFKPGKLNTCQFEIPFFKEVIIMSFSCDHCGFKNTDIKPGGAISEKGKLITLQVKTTDDLNRDLFKSETALISIPEIDFEISEGTLGSFYTTVEGLLDKVVENLETENPFVGDSSDHEQNQKFSSFIHKLKELKEGKMLPFTLIIDDPCDNCFLLNPYYPKEDHQVKMEEYRRTDEQNEKLGINSTLQ